MYEFTMYPNGLPVVEENTNVDAPKRRCIVESCECRDARVLSYRNLRFIKAVRSDAIAYRDPSTLDYNVPAHMFTADIVNDDVISRRLAAISAGSL